MQEQTFNPKGKTLNANLFAKLTIDLFRAGRRTVSWRDWMAALNREFDVRTIELATSLINAVQAIVERAGFPCTPVNEYCLRHCAESPVQDVAMAQRCTVLRSGGKGAVGLRQALADDLVRSETNGVGCHIGVGNVKHFVGANANDVARGITARELHARLQHRLRSELAAIPDIEPEPQQAALALLDEDESEEKDS